jgi:hypothetical protein
VETALAARGTVVVGTDISDVMVLKVIDVTVCAVGDVPTWMVTDLIVAESIVSPLPMAAKTYTANRICQEPMSVGAVTWFVTVIVQFCP